MSDLDMSENNIYNNLINKIINIKEKLSNIKIYTEVNNINNNIEYIENFHKVSKMVHELESCTCDLFDVYILNSPTTILSHEDINKQKDLIINKKIYNTFMPYMLYMNIILQNK